MRARFIELAGYWPAEKTMWIGSRMADVVNVCSKINQTTKEKKCR